MCKLTENSSRDVQIAFANELSLICDKAGINVWELIELANKHPRVNILQPGSGVGGHCIAVDPYFLTSEFPYESQLISKAREINNYKAFWCAEKIENAILRFFLEHHRKPVVALMGLSFKPDIDDLRESPAKYITSKVLQRSADTDILIVEPQRSRTCSLQTDRLQIRLHPRRHRRLPRLPQRIQNITSQRRKSDIGFLRGV